MRGGITAPAHAFKAHEVAHEVLRANGTLSPDSVMEAAGARTAAARPRWIFPRLSADLQPRSLCQSWVSERGRHRAN